MSVVPYEFLSFKIKYQEIMKKYQTQIDDLAAQLFSQKEQPNPLYLQKRKALFKEQGQLQLHKSIFSYFDRATLFYQYDHLSLKVIQKLVAERISESEEEYQKGMSSYYEEILFCACLQDDLNDLHSFLAPTLSFEELQVLIEAGVIDKEVDSSLDHPTLIQAKNEFVFPQLEALVSVYFRRSSMVSVDQKQNWKQVLSDWEHLEGSSFMQSQKKFIEQMEEWLQERISDLVRQIDFYQKRNRGKKQILDRAKDDYISYDKDGMWTFLLSSSDQQKKYQLEFCAETFAESISWEEQVMDFHEQFFQEDDFEKNWIQLSSEEKRKLLQKDLRLLRSQALSHVVPTDRRYPIQRYQFHGEMDPCFLEKRKNGTPFFAIYDVFVPEPWITYADCCQNLLDYYRQPYGTISLEDRLAFLELFEMVHPKKEEALHLPTVKVKKCQR